MEPPLNTIDPQAWDVYRDYALEHDYPESYCDLVWYIVQALKMGPVRMALRGWKTSFSEVVFWDNFRYPNRIPIPYSDGYPTHWLDDPDVLDYLQGFPSDYVGLAEHYPLVAWEYFVRMALKVHPGIAAVHRPYVDDPFEVEKAQDPTSIDTTSIHNGNFRTRAPRLANTEGT